MSAEREVLARVRGASRKTSRGAIEAELAALAPAPSAPLPGDDYHQALIQNLERNGASAARVADRKEAVAALTEYIASRYGQRRFVAGHDARLAALPWREGGLLPRFGHAEPGDALSVSFAQGAIAETGSLYLWLDRDNPALNNLLCEDQVILVYAEDVHPTLERVWDHDKLRNSRARPRGLMMISGPSSTADIAMQLVLGAHGPRALHVLVLGGGDE